MSTFKWFASFVLAATIVPALPAEPHCPGNVASVPLHLTNSHQIIVAVSVNHSGPYNFLLDTGTQITMVDPSLAAELHLSTEGSAVVAGVGFHAAASFAQLKLLEAGSHGVADQKVLVFDIKNPQSADLHLRGVLGEDFLEQVRCADRQCSQPALSRRLGRYARIRERSAYRAGDVDRDVKWRTVLQVADHLGSTVRRDAARSLEA